MLAAPRQVLSAGRGKSPGHGKISLVLSVAAGGWRGWFASASTPVVCVFGCLWFWRDGRPGLSAVPNK